MLVAVIMVFVVFSFTGVAVLNVSYLSSNNSMETKQNIINQYAVESTVNVALWRINNGVDSLATFTDGAVASIYDTTNNILTINIDQFQMEQEITLDLSEDTHFDRSIAVSEVLVDNGNTTNVEESHRSRDFDFLPEVDLAYFVDNAVAVHNGNWQFLDHDDLDEDGIHIFNGNWIFLDDIELENSTLIFTGRHIFFTGENKILAPVPEDSTDAHPALVFTNHYNTFAIAEGSWEWDSGEISYSSPGDRIEGAIFSAGKLILRNGTLTGPIVGRMITLNDNFDFLDAEHNEYYRWTRGFGERSHYDWPKQVNRWRNNHWRKRSHDDG